MIRWTRAVRRALREAPRALMRTGSAPPTAMPRMMGKAAEKVRAPVMLRA